jgi:hypothetical protein
MINYLIGLGLGLLASGLLLMFGVKNQSLIIFGSLIFAVFTAIKILTNPKQVKNEGLLPGDY